MLKLARGILDEIVAQARREAPVEACGYLGEKDGVAVSALPLRNVDASPEHFTLDPAEQFAAVRKLRSEALQLRAVYHSHPASPARPSAEDLRLAHDPSLSYVIVSLLGETPAVKSFRIQNGTATGEEVEVV